MARLLASLLLVRPGWLPLVVGRDDRTSYSDALEQADAGDLSGLVRVFDRLQRAGSMRALSVAAEVQTEQQDELSTVLESLLEGWAGSSEIASNGLDHVARQLRDDDAGRAMAEVRDELESILRMREPRARVYLDTDTPDTTIARALALWQRGL